MIFMGEGGVVVGVGANAEPLTPSQRTVHAPSRYVLEVNGGWSAAHGVKAGDLVRMENVPVVKEVGVAGEGPLEGGGGGAPLGVRLVAGAPRAALATPCRPFAFGLLYVLVALPSGLLAAALGVVAGVAAGGPPGG